MLDKIKEKYNHFITNLDRVNEKLKAKLENKLLEFNDTLALETQWHPLRKGGANFKTKKLVKISSSLYKYKISKQGMIFSSLFLIIGILSLAYTVYVILENKLEHAAIFVTIGIVFSVAGFIMYKYMGKILTFDSTMGIMYYGNKQPKFSGHL